MSKYKLHCVSSVLQCLSYFQREILSESINNDIFMVITKTFVSNGRIVRRGKIIVIDDKGSQYSQRVRSKAVDRLLQFSAGEVVCLPGRIGEDVKTHQVSLCYGKTSYKRKKEGFVKQYGSYSCNTDHLVGKKWDAQVA